MAHLAKAEANLKRHLLVMAYAKTLDVEKAAKESGLEIKIAKRILDDPEVMIAVEAQIERRLRRLGVEADDIVVSLKETAEEARASKRFQAAVEAYKALLLYFGGAESATQTKGGIHLHFGVMPALPAPAIDAEEVVTDGSFEVEERHSDVVDSPVGVPGRADVSR